VDALVTFEPVRSELLKLGAHILFDSSQIPGRILDVMVVRADKMTEHAQALKELIAAHFRALEYQARQPQDAAKRIAPYLRIPEAEVAAQYDGIKIPSLAENHSLLSGSQPKLTATALELADLMLRHKLLAHPVNAGNLVEPRFLPTISQ
jgi:NitT/TauT family transport system substrate-binding protein